MKRQKMLCMFIALAVLLFCYCELSYALTIDVGSAGAYPTIQDGYNAAGNEDIIQVQEGTYEENDNFDNDISVALIGGYNSSFSANESYSVITGTLIISAGTVTAENIIIQPTNQSIVGEWLVEISPIGTFIFYDGLGAFIWIDTHYFYLIVNSNGSLSATIADCAVGQATDCLGSISVSGTVSGNAISNFSVTTQGSILTDNCGSESYFYSLTGTLTPNSSGSISASGNGTDSFTQSLISLNCGSFIASSCGTSSIACFAATKQ